MSKVIVDPGCPKVFQELCSDLEDLQKCIVRLTRNEDRKQFAVVDNGEHFVVSYPMTKEEYDLQLFDQADLNPDPPPRYA